MYSPTLWQHIRNPQNRGELPNADAVGESHYPKCGDSLKLQLRFEEGCIRQARFQAKSCGPVVAVCSVGTQMLTGLTVEEALAINCFHLDQAVGGLPPPKRHAILMFLECIHEALHNFERTSKQP